MNSFRRNFEILVFIFNFLLFIKNSCSSEFRIRDSYSNYHHPASSDGVTSFALPSEEKYQSVDSYYMAFINYSYHEDGVIKTVNGEFGKFGEGRILNVSGILVHVSSKDNPNNHTACDDNFQHVPDERWIALIKRGSCNFEVKVRNAYNHHAAGVIIYNDRDSPTLDKMKIDDKERNITSVFVSRKNGEEMIALLEHFSLTASITEGSRFTKPTNINRTSVLFVSISFIVLMVISLVWLIFYYVQRFRYLQTKDKQSRRLCNVAKRIISKIPTKSIKIDDKEVENDCCAICIEPYKVGDFIRVLPCKHEFHKSCIDPWLLEHRTCPMCKMDILKHYGFVFTGSQESILQLDLDAEEGDGDAISIPSPRRDGVSPLPQIRSMEHQLSRSSSVDSDSDRDTSSSPNEQTPTLKGRNWLRSNATSSHANDVCVGCIAAALTKQNPEGNSNNTFPCHTTTTNSHLNKTNDTNKKFNLDENLINGPSSLPSTLKKYKGHHSTGSCRGFNFLDNQNSNLINNQIKRNDGGAVMNNNQPTTSKSFDCDEKRPENSENNDNN